MTLNITANMKPPFRILGISLFILLSVSAHSQITLGVSMNDRFLVGEPIMIRYKLTNTSDTELVLPYTSGLSFNSVIFKPVIDGKNIPFHFHDHIYLGGSQGILIKPHSSFTGGIDLLAHTPILEPGNYTLITSYRSNGRYLTEDGAVAKGWSGKAPQVRTKFTVRKPTINRNIKALKFQIEHTSWIQTEAGRIPGLHAYHKPKLWNEWQQYEDTRYFLYAAYFDALRQLGRYRDSAADEEGRGVIRKLEEILKSPTHADSLPPLMEEQILFVLHIVSEKLGRSDSLVHSYKRLFDEKFPDSSFPQRNLENGYPNLVW